MISKRVFLLAVVIISASATLVMAQAAVNVDTFVVNNLSIDPTSHLNLGDSGIATTTPYSTIYGYVKSGYAGGAWNGAGINSSAAAADSTVNGFLSLGIMSGDDFVNVLTKSNFYGHTPVLATDSLIKSTYYGDSNFDGKVTDDDFGLFAYGYSVFGTADQVNGWAWGDWNYDGKITDDDFGLFANVYANGGSPMGVLGTPPSSASAAAAVPEPSTIILIIAFATSGLLVSLRKR